MKACIIAVALMSVLLVNHRAYSQKVVKHTVHYGDLRSADGAVSKSQTMDPHFTPFAPLGFPRNGVSFQLDYEIIFVADDENERIDYFAFNAPSGWIITAIGSAPSPTALECEDNPHTGLTVGFSDSSAYWGGDYGVPGGVIPGDPTTYPNIGSRSLCGVWETELAPAAADTHTFSVTMTPSAPGACPGSTTGALPLCCSEGEVSAGGPPPPGSEPYFNEMIAATDGNAEIFGDGYYYVSLECPPPFIVLAKVPVEASVDCDAITFTEPDTLVMPVPPGGEYRYCFGVLNVSDLVTINEVHDPWLETRCDSVYINDPTAGAVFNGPFDLGPGDVLIRASTIFDAPPVDTCVPNIANAICVTPEGSDYVNGEGVLSGIERFSFSAPDSAWVCAESSLPVELAHFAVKSDAKDLLLEWNTASETNNAGFTVEHRLADETAFKQAGFVEGAGTSQTVQHYSFRIEDPGPGRHAVRLKQIDLDGGITYSPVLLTEVEVPGDYYLTAAYPNPFTASATVEFAVPASQDVRLDLVDVQGRPVRTIFDGRLEANARRKAVIDAVGIASGTYFLRMSGERFQTSQTVTVAK